MDSITLWRGRLTATEVDFDAYARFLKPYVQIHPCCTDLTDVTTRDNEHQSPPLTLVFTACPPPRPPPLHSNFRYVKEVAHVSDNMGKMSTEKSISLPKIAGLTVHGYVQVTLDVDDVGDMDGMLTGMQTVVQGGVAVGLKYDSESQGVLGGSIAEVAFKPEFNMAHGIIKDSLIPTLSLLGSEPLPITSDPVRFLHSSTSQHQHLFAYAQS